MKKLLLLLYVLTPTIVGYIYDLLLPYPIGGILPYIMPVLMIIFWFWVGGQFARTRMNLFQAVLTGNSVGLISLAVYIWQFLLTADEQRNMLLARFSQMFGAVTDILTVRIAALFIPESDVYGAAQTTNMILAMQIINLIVMIIVFTLGYLWRKRKKRRTKY